MQFDVDSVQIKDWSSVEELEHGKTLGDLYYLPVKIEKNGKQVMLVDKIS